MKVTEALKAHLRDQFGLPGDAADPAVKDLASAKILSGELDGATFARLTEEKAAAAGTALVAEIVKGQVDGVRAEFRQGFDALAQRLEGLLAAKAAAPAPAPEPPALNPADPGHLAKLVQDEVKAHLAKAPAPPEMTPVELFARHAMQLNEGRPGGTDLAGRVEVRNAWKQYDSTRKSAFYPQRTQAGGVHLLAGQPARLGGQALDHPSDLDKAVAAAFFKWAATKGGLQVQDVPAWLRPTDHDRELVAYAAHELPWAGVLGGIGSDFGAKALNRQKLGAFERKAVIDDATSGGLEAAPIAFDDAIILTPVLYGELFPLVEVVNITRGRRVEGAAMLNPTVGTGQQEGTEITLFNTAGMVTAVDTTIFAVNGAIEIGLDFEEDSPVNFGQVIVQKYGEKFMEYFDNQIANGDGTTEPQGIFVATGTTLVPADNGTTGPATVGDYEGLMFGVAKEFRMSKGGRCCFVGNDTSYSRARSIAVGPSDERRVFGMGHASYMLLDHPYKVQNNIGNSSIAYANLAWYRWYRRTGVNVRIETAGDHLARSNQKLIVCRVRVGGRLTHGGAAAVMTDAEA